MYFSKPSKPGQILRFESKIVYAGKTSLISYVQVLKTNTGEVVVDGFITFIFVDENTQAVPHYLAIAPKTEKDKELYEKAKNLKNH